MKLLKIVLIIVLLCVPLISYGTGSITSGDKTIDLEELWGEVVDDVTLENRDIYHFKWTDKPEGETSTLNEWFYRLNLSEKIIIYLNYKGGK